MARWVPARSPAFSGLEKFFEGGRGKGSPYLLALANWGCRGEYQRAEREAEGEERKGMGGGEESRGVRRLCLSSPPNCLALPSSLSSSALRGSDANWLGSSPSRRAPLSGSSSPSLPSCPSPPPFNLSLPRSFPLLLLRRTAAGPTRLQTRSPAPPLLSSSRRSPSIQPRMPGAPDRGTHKKHRFLLIPFNFAHAVDVSYQNTTLQRWHLHLILSLLPMYGRSRNEG